jgi:hypothetical protein
MHSRTVTLIVELRFTSRFVFRPAFAGPVAQVHGFFCDNSALAIQRLYATAAAAAAACARDTFPHFSAHIADEATVNRTCKRLHCTAN